MQYQANCASDLCLDDLMSKASKFERDPIDEASVRELEAGLLAEKKENVAKF